MNLYQDQAPCNCEKETLSCSFQDEDDQVFNLFESNFEFGDIYEETMKNELQKLNEQIEESKELDEKSNLKPTKVDDNQILVQKLKEQKQKARN